jgi:thioesterase-3
MGHQTKIIVRGYHLDVYGHVNNARYLEFLEEARWAACDNKPATLAWFMQQHYALTVNRIEIDYKRPATMGEHLLVKSDVLKRETKHWLLSQDIVRQSDDKLIVSAQVYVCVVSPNHRGALPIEGEVAEKMMSFLG